MKNNLCIVSHLGLGDHLICNAIVRHHAQDRDLVVVPCKFHNLESVSYMFHDLANVVVRGVLDHDDQVFFAQKVWKHDVLWLGLNNHPFEPAKFDSEFYRQAGLDFDLRWSGFKVRREPGVEEESRTATIFLHEDRIRGMAIDPGIMDKATADSGVIRRSIYAPHKTISGNIFAYINILKTVQEVHVINSSFALLIDSIDLPQEPKLYLHLYTRPNSEIPTFRKNWIRLEDYKVL